VLTDLSVTNWADTEAHTLKVLVSAAGAVTYEYDGSAPTGAVAFTFDSTDVVVPSMVFTRAGTATATQIELQTISVGYQ